MVPCRSIHPLVRPAGESAITTHGVQLNVVDCLFVNNTARGCGAVGGAVGGGTYWVTLRASLGDAKSLAG
jgi:hypothetical protein